MSPKTEDALSLDRMATEVETALGIPPIQEHPIIQRTVGSIDYLYDELPDSSTLALRMVCSKFMYLYEDIT